MARSTTEHRSGLDRLKRSGTWAVIFGAGMLVGAAARGVVGEPPVASTAGADPRPATSPCRPANEYALLCDRITARYDREC